MKKTLIMMVALLMAATVTFGADAPMMVRVSDLENRMTTIKTTLDQYRSGLDSWSGTFRIDKIYTKEMINWIRSDSKKEPGQASWSGLLTAEVSKTGATKVSLALLDKDGNIVPPIRTGDESDPDLKEWFDLARQMLFATSVGSSWDYYAGVKTGETEEEVWANFTATRWDSFQLSKSMGYIPTRIEYGAFGSVPADYTIFSDFRKSQGRWTAYKMVETMLVPDQTMVGITTTVTAQRFDFVLKLVITKK